MYRSWSVSNHFSRPISFYTNWVFLAQFTLSYFLASSGDTTSLFALTYYFYSGLSPASTWWEFPFLHTRLILPRLNFSFGFLTSFLSKRNNLPFGSFHVQLSRSTFRSFEYEWNSLDSARLLFAFLSVLQSISAYESFLPHRLMDLLSPALSLRYSSLRSFGDYSTTLAIPLAGWSLPHLSTFLVQLFTLCIRWLFI